MGSLVLQPPKRWDQQSAGAGAQASWTAAVFCRFSHSRPLESARRLAQSSYLASVAR
jgi:hypothetical protein